MSLAFVKRILPLGGSLALTSLFVVSPALFGQGSGFPLPPAANSNSGGNQGATAPTSGASAQQLKVQKLLAIHRALSDAQDLLRRGQHVEAVNILERELPQIDGDKEYLRTLQDSYHGAIQDLARAGNTVEADVYLKRLNALQAPVAQAPAAPVNTPPAFNPIATSNNPSAETAPTAPAGRVHILGIEPQNQLIQKTGATTGAPAVAETIIRGNLDDDPFSTSNFAKDANPKPQPKTNLANFTNPQGGAPATNAVGTGVNLRDADQAFRSGQFAQAAKLFEKAYQEGVRVEGVDRERWGYSKLAALVDSFNQGQVHEAMIVEVDQAVSLSPRLNDLGSRVRSQVLASLSDAGRNKGSMGTGSLKSNNTEIRRVQGAGVWQAVESGWFRVFHQGSEETAAEVARQADQAKVNASRRWLGHDGDPWPYRCDIWLYPTGEMYSKATGVPGSSPGHSTFKAENTRVLERKIELRMDHPNLVDAVLPHEVTHVVLAGQFGKNFLPRWLDEGMAILSEPRERIRRHTDHIPRYASEGTLLTSAQLMTMADYPEANKVGIFYAQSVSLVDYMCSLKGPQAFTIFVKEAIHSDWETALRKHYGISGYDALDRQWRGDWVAARK